MKNEEYKKKKEDLFEKWKQTRPEYESEVSDFAYDGPSNWDKWIKQEPKILFLAKEPHSGYHSDTSIEGINGTFFLNIARWKYAIKKLYANSSELPAFPSDEDLRCWSENSNDDIAIVKVKKANQNLKITNNKEIEEYAKRDKEFLKEQIDLINPDVVLCCYTIDSYDIIYEDSWDELYSINESHKCKCYKHQNRLVIDFYHPSQRSNFKEWFELLCKLLKEGEVFEKFKWNQTIKTAF